MTRLAPLVLLVLVLSACAGEPGAQEPDAASPGSADTSSPEEEQSDRAGRDRDEAAVPETLEFTGTTVGGKPFEGASLTGKPALLWFWAPWCPTCRSQVPQVEGLAAEHDGELNVVGVGSLDSAEAIAGFADDVEGVTHLEDLDGELWKRFGVTEQSSFVLLDAEGSVAFETGYGGSDDLGAQVEDVLG